MSHRTDLNSLPAAKRTALVNLMLTYINDAVVWKHNPNNPNAIVHHMGEHAFITHRNYIGDLEDWLAAHGGAEFVPLPAWNSASPIPAEFNVVKPRDDGTPRPALVNLNPAIPKPANLNLPAVCSTTTNGDVLWDTYTDGWHGNVHITIGGTMGDITIAPAAPIFFCWHSFIDDIYEDWLLCRWSGWEDLGGIITSGVGVSSWGSGRLDCFVKGQDNHMWHKWYSGSWSGWEDLGGIIDGTPAAVSWGSGRIDCFARGMDNHMWHKSYSGSWSGWEDLGGIITDGPAAAAWATNRSDTFAKGADNALWYKWRDATVVHNHAGVWSRWQSLGGIIDDQPGAVSWGPGRIDVFVRGMNNHMWHKWRS